MRPEAGLCIAPTGATRTRFGETPAYPEGLYDLGHGLYAWMVPNGSWGESNAGLIVGADASLLVDTLWDVRKTRAMLEAMTEVRGGSEIRTLVNTHADGDHFWGNQLVAEAEIITSEASLREMHKHTPKMMALFERLGRLAAALPTRDARRVGHWFQAMCAPYRFDEVVHTPAKSSFSGRHSLQVSGREVRLIEVGPAHTQGDLMVHVPDAKTLFSGDILFIGSTPVMWAGPSRNWIRALETILDMDLETIVPGHGPLSDKTGVATVKLYWDFVGGEARKRYEAGMSAKQAATEILSGPDYCRMPFADWDSPERMMTNVQVLYREFQGRTRPLKPLQIINILRKQAILAHALPDASPASMRLREN